MLDHDLLGDAIAEVNATFEDSYTALHFAANQGHLNAVRLIVSKGKRLIPDARNFMYRTPLHLASMMGHLEIAQLLISYKADVNAIDTDGNTPIHFAAQNEYVDMVQYFLTKDPDLNI
jgi:ankyrin repeat protein